MPKIDPTKLNKEITDKYSVVNNAFRAKVKDNPKDLVVAEIGDTKDADFKPQMKICRWGDTENDNEVNVSLRLVHDEKTPIVTAEDGKIKWKGDKVEAHFYDFTNTDHPEGASEFEVILKKKPKTNVVSFTIQTKGLDFFYQPPLTQAEIDQGSFRPENVIDSYAVYYKDGKSGDFSQLGGKNYKIGKAFHIYRIKATDSNGVPVWGKQNIDVNKKLYTIEIPQEFLDSAVYPVTIDPNFGYESVGASESGNGPNATGVSHGPLFIPASSGTVSSVFLYLKSAGTTSATKACLYSNSSNAPDALLGASAEVTVDATWGWDEFPLSASVISGNDYHIGFNSATANRIMYDSATISRGWNYRILTYGTFADPFGTASYADNVKVSFYATYTASVSSVVKDIICSNGLIVFPR